MALGLPNNSSGGADFLPRIQYDARAGRFFRIDRIQQGGEWVSTSAEIPLPAKFAIDFENIEVGWIFFAKTGPDFRLVRIGQPLPPRPDNVDDKGKPVFKPGFKLRVYNKVIGLREFTSSAGCVIEQIDAMHSAWESQHGEHPGKVAVVSIARTFPVQSGQSTNYAPEMVIEQWIDRPAEMSGTAAPQAAPARQAAPAPAAPPQTVAPPPPAAQPAAAAPGEYF
jgi:hypothetical protein